MQKPEGDSLERLGDKLYSRDFPEISNFPKPRLPSDDATGPKRWQGTEEMFSDTPSKPPRPFPFKAVILGAIIFFVICVIAALVIIYQGANTLSVNNLDITFLGPVTTQAGGTVDFSVVVKNNNPTAVSNAVLYLEYPAGTMEATDTTTVLSHTSVSLGTIPSGGSVTQNMRAVFYGPEHATEEIAANVTYSIPNSNANFQKQKTYDIGISSAPLLLTVNAPSETPAGAPVVFSLSLTSNSSNPPSNVLVTAQYPFGFQFASSTPSPSFNQSEWVFPTLAASSTKTITIAGYLQGQENDQQTIRFLVGTQSANDPKKLSVIYLSQNQTMTIRRSPIALQLAIGRTTGDAVIGPGFANGTLTLTNNLPVSLLNTQVTLTVSGNALDASSVSAGESGVYRQSSQQITWDRLSVPSLGQFDPGQQVMLDFSFNTLSADKLAALKNGSINLVATVNGQQLGATADAAPISAKTQATARLASAVGLIAHAVYSTGPFTNTGPVPPKVDTATTYTIIWTLTNSSNIVSGGTVVASLPPYVHWMNVISPAGAAISFDSTKNVVMWKPGDLSAAGASPVASVAFQVQVEPMASQVGSAPNILENISFQGTDAFVNVPVSDTADPLTTSISTDPTYGGQNGFVQK